ncbi:transposase [Loktanella salsilacus]|jgi:transposase|uniref:transposase n=1 Tax=Loktanella salsilacus TaxID=195913 RepID=UPI0037039F93
MSKGIRFTDEFKRDAVAQVVERGYAVSEVAERLGISNKSLYTWKAQFSKPPHVRAEVLDQAAEPTRWGQTTWQCHVRDMQSRVLGFWAAPGLKTAFLGCGIVTFMAELVDFHAEVSRVGG